ncbi:hypothetical protein [Paenibacillus abyssi]|uniref:hypothetical protein n=1 Tax=Paenibacillus abyssi TaxID=1340531 RepID=UPI001663DEC4|nr:hypothetical protein [Paenibacillus abyssi]
MGAAFAGLLNGQLQSGNEPILDIIGLEKMQGVDFVGSIGAETAALHEAGISSCFSIVNQPMALVSFDSSS